ncbi:MAG TPA: hypothetical protein VN830_08720 [Verrucomicrobiae bacterium]|nr:hypothetical protein [Verrucomicrobiae bacterium]
MPLTCKKRTSLHLASIPHFIVDFFFVASSIVCLASPVSAAKNNTLTTPGIVREFAATPDEVRQAVLAVLHDQIIHGTLVFDKEPTLTGAEVVDSTPFFEPWQGAGELFYKVRRNVIAPRHFLESADQGTIAVRYVVIPVNAERTRVKIDAVYVESARHKMHASDGTVEKSEMQEIKNRIEAAQEAAQEAAEGKRRHESAELVHQTYIRQREDEATRLSDAQSAEKQLEQRVKDLRHNLERRVKAPGADLKAAPFQSAASLKVLAAYTEVIVLIVTPHWLGIETPEGQRGWISEEHLEQLP